MTNFEIGAVVSAVLIMAGPVAGAVAGPVAGQEALQISNGWRKVDASTPAYVNAATLMVCPETLSDGYRLYRADVYSTSTDVSCGYRLGGTASAISFYYYPALGAVSGEFTSTSRPVLERLAPGVTPVEGQRTWLLGGVSVEVPSLEVRGSDRLGQSFAIADSAGRRMKARETWEGPSEVSHRVADRFFALQTDAMTNAQNCAALPTWPTTRKARLSSDPFAASMTAAFVLGTFMKTSPGEANQANVKSCVLGSLGRSDRGSSLLLTRNGPSGVQLALDDQPQGNLLAGLANVELGATLQLPGDARFALYSREGQSSSIYRLYKTIPNWEQIRSDMILVATNELPPLVRIEPKLSEDGMSININPEESEREKQKRRPGSQ
jgi:hypothetical protein